MKNKPFWVVFTATNARVLKGVPEGGDDYLRRLGNRALFCPDLTKVQGIPPHFWKLERDPNADRMVIVPMSEAEAEVRVRDIEKFGVLNDPEAQPLKEYAEAVKAAWRAGLHFGIACGWIAGSLFGMLLGAHFLG